MKKKVTHLIRAEKLNPDLVVITVPRGSNRIPQGKGFCIKIPKKTVIIPSA